MDFNSIPALEDIVLQNVSVWIWSETDIKELMLQHYEPTSNTAVSVREALGKLKEIEDRIMVRAFTFQMPELLKSKLRSFVRSIGRQILTWVDFHRHYCAYDVNLPMKFFWTARGDIDQRKTAIYLVRNSDIEIGIRCTIAEIHFIEDFNKLKTEMEDQRKGDNVQAGYRNLHIPLRNIRKSIENAETIPDALASNFMASCRGCEYELVCAAVTGNVEETRYYLEKFAPDEVREETLEKTICLIVINYRSLSLHNSVLWSNRLTTVLQLFLSALKTEKRMQLMSNRPLETLNCFLDWPWRHYFQGILKIVVPFLEWKDFDSLLQEIFRRYSANPGDFRLYFMHIWQEIPQTIKKRSLMEDSLNVLLLTELFLKEHEDCSTMILKDAIDLVELEFLFSEAGKNICRNLMLISKGGNLFDFFIRTCLTTKESMIKFKGELMDYVTVCNQSPNENNLMSTASECEKAMELMDTHIERCADENTEIRINEMDCSKNVGGKNVDFL